MPAEAGDAEVEWPDDAEESAFLSESAARGEAPALLTLPSGIQVTGGKLPPLEELVAKVPTDVAALLDDLFRAKFTGVRKYADTGGPRTEPK